MAVTKWTGRTPKHITSAIREFAIEMTGQDRMSYVPIRGLEGLSEELMCYHNCATAQQIFGGELVLGYSIWSSRDLLLDRYRNARKVSKKQLRAEKKRERRRKKKGRNR